MRLVISFTESRVQAMIDNVSRVTPYRITKPYHSAGELAPLKEIHPRWELIPVGARRIAYVASGRGLHGTERREIGAESHRGKETLRPDFWNRQLYED